MSIKLIAIDDGHGVDTQGKRTPAFNDGSVMLENEFNSSTAEELKKALERCGFETILVAPENTDTPLKTRVKRANEAKANLYISIHANAYGVYWNEVAGIETYVYSLFDVETVKAAKLIQKELIADTGAKDRGVKADPQLYVLNSTKMPAVLAECGFMTNLVEAAKLKTLEYRKLCAEAICKGVCKYFSVTYVPDIITENLIKIIIDGTEQIIDGIQIKDSAGGITNYAKIRSIAPLLGYNVSNNGSMAILNKK